MNRGLSAEEVYKIAVPKLELTKPEESVGISTESDKSKAIDVELLEMSRNIPKKKREIAELEKEADRLEKREDKLYETLVRMSSDLFMMRVSPADKDKYLEVLLDKLLKAAADRDELDRLLDAGYDLDTDQDDRYTFLGDNEDELDLLLEYLEKYHDLGMEKQGLEFEAIKKTSDIEKERASIPEIQKRIKELEKPKTSSDLIRESNKLLAPFLEKPHLVIKFEDIRNYSSIHRLMTDDNNYPENRVLLIIYRSQPNYGHWVGLYYNDYGINYLNSYGSYIDKSIDAIPEQFKKISQQNYPYLLKLLSEAPMDVYYNNIKLQKMLDKDEDGSVVPQTCGRYVGWFFYITLLDPSERIETTAKNLKKLAKKNKITVDDLIVKITEKQLNADYKPKVTWIGLTPLTNVS